MIDVGYAGVIGADRLAHGKPLYGNFPKDNEHGDTYGPVNYEAYVPFEQALPWSGRWDDLPAAHGAAIAFDLLTLLLPVPARAGASAGPRWASCSPTRWAAYPFTLYVANCNTNDALVAALRRRGAPRRVASPAARGAATALAGLTKFAPLALAPLFATYGAPRRAAAGRSLAVRRSRFARDRGGVSLPGPPARRVAAHVLRPHDRLPGRPRVAVLDLGALRLGRAPARAGSSRRSCSPLVAAFLPRRRDVVGLAALGGRGRDRAAARRDALVLPLPRVVPPARAGRALRRAIGGADAGRGDRRLSAPGAGRRWRSRSCGAGATVQRPAADATSTTSTSTASTPTCSHDGLVPYCDFAFEYPPLALAPIAPRGSPAATLRACLRRC